MVVWTGRMIHRLWTHAPGYGIGRTRPQGGHEAMLSDREQQELARIEEALRADDRRFADSLRRGPRIGRTRRWPARALLGFGVAVLVIGVLTSAGMLVFQGILLTGAGVAWVRWLAAHGGSGDGAAGSRPRPGARPDGPPTGRGQPV
jgi:hypothetical protein